MGSTHPPLESLLKFSQTCLQGFEASSLNRIAMLRTEFRQLLDEWIEVEIEAQFARWVLEHRRVRDSSANQSALPAFDPPQLSFHNLTHDSAQFLLSSSDELPVEFRFASIVQFGDSADIDLRLPLRHLPVSLDAAAALRSLEHFAYCTPRAIGDQPLDLLDLDAPGLLPSGPFFPFPQGEPARKLRTVSLQMTYVLAATTRSAHHLVRYASTFATNDPSALGEPAA